MPRKNVAAELQRIKWTVRIRPNHRRAVRVLAAQTDWDVAAIIEEALESYLEAQRRSKS